jgi:hypothetical protein
MPKNKKKKKKKKKNKQIKMYFSKFFKGYDQNLKGDNAAAFVDGFLARMSPKAAGHFEDACSTLAEIQNKNRFRKRFLNAVAMAYLHGVEDQKRGEAIDVLALMKEVHAQGFEKLKKYKR